MANKTQRVFFPGTTAEVMPRDIAAYLRTIHSVTSATPCTLTIKGTVYPAAQYVQHCTVDPDCRAYAEGKREYDRMAIIVAGPLPACVRNGNVAFTLAGMAHECYVACYYPAHKGRTPQINNDCKLEFSQYHPFGMDWHISPWDIADSKIDSFERVPYKRVVCEVKPV